MREGGDRLRFSLETLAAFGVGPERCRQNFQRDASPEPGIVGFVDLTHATRAEQRPDLVSAETRAGRK
jgi:hypothetical protein